MSEIRNRKENHPKSDDNDDQQNSIQQNEYKESKDACCGLCCVSTDDCCGFCFFMLGFCCPLFWCCYFFKNRKSKKFEKRLFAYLSCIGCSVVLIIIFVYLIGAILGLLVAQTFMNNFDNIIVSFFDGMTKAFEKNMNDYNSYDSYDNVETYEYTTENDYYNDYYN